MYFRFFLELAKQLYKVYFDSIADLEAFLKQRAQIDCEVLPVDEYKFLPKRYFSCHADDHLAANCNNISIRSRCLANDLASTTTTTNNSLHHQAA